jgi:hypothetical protein
MIFLSQPPKCWDYSVPQHARLLAHFVGIISLPPFPTLHRRTRIYKDLGNWGHRPVGNDTILLQEKPRIILQIATYNIQVLYFSLFC